MNIPTQIEWDISVRTAICLINFGSLGIHGVIPKNGRIIVENNTNIRNNFHGYNEPKLG
jgi:hypothetical protein